MEGTQRNIVWAIPLTPDQNMLPDQETIDQLLTQGVAAHDEGAMRALFPPFHEHVETLLPLHPSENFLLCAYNKSRSNTRKKALRWPRFLTAPLSSM